MIPAPARAFLLAGHELYCFPWMIPVLTIIGMLAFLVASILAYPWAPSAP